MDIPVRKSIESLKPYPPGKPIEEVRREYNPKRIIKLASNENPLGPSPRAISALRKTLKGINRYPDGNVYVLRKALSEKLDISADSLIFGNGSDEIFLLIALSFLESSNNIIISERAFPRYQMEAQITGTKTKRIPMKNWRHDTETMARSIDDRTKAIVFSSPNNPVGCMVKRGEFESLIAKVPRNVLVVVDEAYREYVSDREYPDTLKYLRKHKNLIILRTFSKAYGLAGLRIGYGIADPWIVDKINCVRPPFNVNIAAQCAATAALEDEEHVLRSVELVENGKQYFYGEFDKLGLFYVKSYGNFVLLDAGFSSKEISEELLRNGIIVRPMAGFGLETFLRVTIGKPTENKAFIRAFKTVLCKFRKGDDRS